MEWGFIVAGWVVGFIVGLTGVGGGSLMTPILLWFGISPSMAVGTDLLYAAITKGGGVIVHHRKGNVDWRLVGILAAGSLPASLITLYFLSQMPHASGQDQLLKFMLGLALVLTSFAILAKHWLLNHLPDRFKTADFHPPHALIIVIGAMLGFLVTLSSIGAGALGTLALFLLFPLLATSRLVGTEIAHAIPLTLVAGLGHAKLGNVNLPLLINLLAGSLPGIWMGSHLSSKVNDHWLRRGLAIMLAFVGLKLMFQ